MTITFAKPNFAKQADHTCDVSDNWIDHVDTENEDGAEVTAYFAESDGFLSLTGLRIKDDLETTWEGREGAIKSLTPDTVRRIEDVESDCDHFGIAAQNAAHERSERFGWENV